MNTTLRLPAPTSPITMIGLTGDIFGDPDRSYDGRIKDPVKCSSLLNGCIEKAVGLGDRHIVIHATPFKAPHDKTPDGKDFHVRYTMTVNGWSGHLPHVQAYFASGMWRQVAEKVSGGKGVRMEVYRGTHTSRTRYLAEGDLAVYHKNYDKPNDAIHFLEKSLDERRQLWFREVLPIAACGFDGQWFDATGAKEIDQMKAEMPALPPGHVYSGGEAYSLVPVKQGVPGYPGGVQYTLDLSRPDHHQLAMSSYHKNFDPHGLWVVPKGFVFHCIVDCPMSEKELVSLHNRGFILGWWMGAKDMGDGELIRRVRNRVRKRPAAVA